MHVERRRWCVQSARSHYHTYWSILENALVEIISPPDIGPGIFWQCLSPVTLLDFFSTVHESFRSPVYAFFDKIIFPASEFPRPIRHCVSAIRMCLKILITLIDKKISILIAKQLQRFSMAIHVRPKFTLRSSAIHATPTLSFTVSGARSCKMSIIFYTRRNVCFEYKRRHRCNERKTYLLV